MMRQQQLWAVTAAQMCPPLGLTASVYCTRASLPSPTNGSRCVLCVRLFLGVSGHYNVLFFTSTATCCTV